MRRGTVAVVKKRAGTAATGGVSVSGAKKLVKEHYLRDDIVCGSEACTVCDHQTAAAGTKPVLSATPASTALFATKHYVVPDVDVLLHQMDVIEHSFFVDVVVLETVLAEVKTRAPAAYERLRDLIANPERRFFVFLNEHFGATFVEREKDESAQERVDRAVRKAAKWYTEHLQESNLSAVLLTEDGQHLEAAQEAGCTVSSVFAYVEALKNVPELRDVLVRPAESFAGDNEGSFAAHVSKDEFELGLKTGRYEKGNFNISPYDHNEAIVWVQGADMRVIVEGVKNMNRAVHDDQVIVEIFPKEQWQHPSTKADVKEQRPSGSIALTINEPMLNDQASQPTGKVVAVLKRNWRPYCGSLAVDTNAMAVDDKEGSTVLFVPVDRRIPRVWIKTRQAAALHGKRVVVSIDSWAETSSYPCGHYIRTIGTIGEKSTESEVIMIEHDIPHYVSHAILSCLPPQGDKWTVNKHGGHDERRRDLRHISTLCSVDPPGCTDIDDALHVRKLDNGNFEVGVHIADVSYFVRPGNAMDLEASQRGTTVYLVDKRIDMLPELLGTNLCSLRCNVDRFAFSCLWEMTADGDTVNVDFCKSIINSRASLEYSQAQERIDDQSATDELSISLKTLNMLAKKLNHKRRNNGALALASPEVRIALQRDSQDPVDVEMKEMKEANSMVEEFMLLANISVAEKIHEVFQQCSLLRRHAVPAPSRFDYLVQSARSQGIDIDPTTSKSLADSLDKAITPSKPYLNRLIRILTTRCMTQAQYICSGKFTADQFQHYGLAANIYTHFTSPIRRYADVVVHRLLAAAVGADTTYPEMLDKDHIHRVCRNLNKRHKLAQLCGRASVQLYTVLFFKEKSVVEDAHIIRVLENGIVVMVPAYGLEGVVTVTSDADGANSAFEYDAANNRLFSKAHKVAFNLFDRVRVLIRTDESDPLLIRLELKLVEPVVPGVSVNASSVAALPSTENNPATPQDKKAPKRSSDTVGSTSSPLASSSASASASSSPSASTQKGKKAKLAAGDV